MSDDIEALRKQLRDAREQEGFAIKAVEEAAEKAWHDDASTTASAKMMDALAERVRGLLKWRAPKTCCAFHESGGKRSLWCGEYAIEADDEEKP